MLIKHMALRSDYCPARKAQYFRLSVKIISISGQIKEDWGVKSISAFRDPLSKLAGTTDQRHLPNVSNLPRTPTPPLTHRSRSSSTMQGWAPASAQPPLPLLFASSRSFKLSIPRGRRSGDEPLAFVNIELHCAFIP